MPRYKFTGLVAETFPYVQGADGFPLVCEPGDVVELAEEVEHARLEPTKQKAHHSEPADAEPAPEDG